MKSHLKRNVYIIIFSYYILMYIYKGKCMILVIYKFI